MCASGTCGGRCCPKEYRSCMCPQPSAGNLVQNGGFDSDLSGWTIEANDGEVAWVPSDVTDCPYSGAMKLSLPAGASLSPRISQCVETAGGELHAQIKAKCLPPFNVLNCSMDVFAEPRCVGTAINTRQFPRKPPRPSSTESTCPRRSTRPASSQGQPCRRRGMFGCRPRNGKHHTTKATPICSCPSRRTWRPRRSSKTREYTTTAHKSSRSPTFGSFPRRRMCRRFHTRWTPSSCSRLRGKIPRARKNTCRRTCRCPLPCTSDTAHRTLLSNRRLQHSARCRTGHHSCRPRPGACPRHLLRTATLRAHRNRRPPGHS